MGYGEGRAVEIGFKNLGFLPKSFKTSKVQVVFIAVI